MYEKLFFALCAGEEVRLDCYIDTVTYFMQKDFILPSYVCAKFTTSSSSQPALESISPWYCQLSVFTASLLLDVTDLAPIFQAQKTTPGVTGVCICRYIIIKI